MTEDTEAFHAALPRRLHGAQPDLLRASSASGPTTTSSSPTARSSRGVGGIFYDHLECADEAELERNFAFTRDVGEAFLDVFPRIVRARMGQEWTEADKQQPARMARALCRVQPGLRPRHVVRPQDRRQYRRDPDEPAARGEVELSSLSENTSPRFVALFARLTPSCARHGVGRPARRFSR